jgi:hypothetical protein
MTTIEETWDYSLILGAEAEMELADILTSAGFNVKPYEDGKQKEADLIVNNTLVEVKRDMMWDRTGNFAVEYEFRGKPSGLAATKADIFVIAADKFYCFQSQTLKDWLHANWKYLRKTNGGDSLDAKMVLARQEDIKKIAICIIEHSGLGAKGFPQTHH